MFNDIVDLLTPDMGDPNGRRALVQSAIFSCSVLDRIDWSGPAHTFTINLVTALLDHGDCEPGKPALVSLLETARNQKGKNKHPRYNDLIARVEQANDESVTPNQGAETVDNVQIIAFLISTGVWARTHLGENWKLRRQQQTDKPPIELENEAMMETEAPAELNVPSVKTNQATEILEKMHKNIADWLDEKEEVDRLINLGTLDEIRGDRRKKDLDKKINAKLEEIPTTLARLGVKIDRE